MTEEKKQPQEEKAQEQRPQFQKIKENLLKYFKEQVILDDFEE
jgi:uncharacterized protein YjgD (DUF1641 family)